MSVRFIGLCAPHIGYEFHIESLILGPFAVEDLTQHDGYCSAETEPLEMVGMWVSVDDSSGWSSTVAYPVTIDVPEPSLTLSLAVGSLILWWLA